MKNTRQKGRWGEDVAAGYLQKKSYKILHQNWKMHRGDIDIIALSSDYIVFVEVKSGSSELYGPPELRLTRSKKKQLTKLATAYIQQSGHNFQNHGYRFDVVVIDGTPNKYTIRHYEDAFEV